MHPYLFTDFRRNALSFPPFNTVLDIGLLHIAFFCCNILLVFLVFSGFYHEGLWKFVKSLLCID